METYKTRQIGWVIILVCLLVLFITTLLTVISPLWEEKLPFIAGSVIILVVLLLFYQLTVEVDQEKVSFYMGIGLINKRIYFKNIKSCRPIKNSWILGWGIRLWFTFTLYNVSGFKSVELELYNKKRKIRIGTNDPVTLCAEISKRLGPGRISESF
jgi:hypothetical protein